MTNPTLISTPFAQNGDKSVIQETTGSEPNSATWEAGFPVITSEPISTGGLPPKRVDFNGALNAITDNIVHQSKGLMYEFDAAYATKIGGYPLNARLLLTNGDIVQNTIEANTNDPNTNMTGWENPKISSVSSYDNVSDLLSIATWEGRTVYIHNSGFYSYIGGVWKNVSVGFGGTVYLDDIVSSVDGSTNCSPQINAALIEYSGKGVTLVGNPSSIYKLEATVSFIGTYNVAIDFNGATILDNVQGFIPASGGRANHTFVIYDSNSTKVKNFNYTVAPTRANAFPSNGIPTCIFWVGGQYLGGALTSNIEIKGIKATNQAPLDAMFTAAMGELDGLTIEDVFLDGGDWRWGVNFEYGLQPVNWDTNPTMTNGRHPYDIEVHNVHGRNLSRCVGFLRPASCYNIKFSQCTGFNVPSFIYYYSGDRGISRFDQNVIFEQCIAKFDPNVYNLPQYTVNVIVTDKDGSTGEVLPTWTNRDHLVKFVNCEFFGTRGLNGAAFRFTGSDGKVVLDNCTLGNSYYGLWAQALTSGNPATDSPYTLTLRDCVFKNNYGDVRQIDTGGVLYDNCKFKKRAYSADVPYQIGLFKVSGTCSGTTFRHCNLSDQAQSEIAMRIESEGVYLESNNFKLFNTTTVAVSSTVAVTGKNNTTNGLLTNNTESAFRIIGDTPQIKVFTDVSNNDTVSFNSSAIWLVNSTQTIEQISGGVLGDTIDFRAGTSGSNVTFVHNGAGATTATRILNKSAANDNIVGLTMSRRYMKFSDGWREM